MCHVLHSQLFNIFSLLILINFERLLPVSPFIPLKIEKQSRGGLLFTQSITRLGMREAGCTLRPDSGTAALLPTRCTVCTLHFRVCMCVCACVHARGEGSQRDKVELEWHIYTELRNQHRRSNEAGKGQTRPHCET